MTRPVFAHGHLRLYLLSVLADASMHGYELMQELEQRFGGTYIPSAGTIYPRLAKLEDEGLVAKTTDGRKTVYTITDAGRAELAARSAELDDIENDVTDSVRRLANGVRASVNDAMKTLRSYLASAAREARADARGAGRSTQADPQRHASTSHLREAEMALDDFRHNMRADLRGWAVHT
ncbi:MAG: PadR family transcriptional regulator, partial [Lacisediminihabitans sp.]